MSYIPCKYHHFVGFLPYDIPMIAMKKTSYYSTPPVYQVFVGDFQINCINRLFQMNYHGFLNQFLSSSLDLFIPSKMRKYNYEIIPIIIPIIILPSLPGLVNVYKKRTGKIHHVSSMGIHQLFRLGHFPLRKPLVITI